MVCILEFWKGTHLHRNRHSDCCNTIATKLHFRTDLCFFPKFIGKNPNISLFIHFITESRNQQKYLFTLILQIDNTFIYLQIDIGGETQILQPR